MELGRIFYEKDFSNACDYSAQNDYTIKEIKPDYFGRRFQIVEIPQPTEKQLAQQEIQELKTWLDIDYARKEQKLRRLHTLGKLTDEGANPYDELIKLYNKAEIKRVRIKELERLLSDNSK